MKELFNVLIQETIAPRLKQNGFKKRGLNFTRSTVATQQLLNFQKSQGNSVDAFTFYVNCGILVNGLQDEQRKLKSPSDADIRLRIADISSCFTEDGIRLHLENGITNLQARFSKAIEEEILPFLETHSTEKTCITEMVKNNGLYRSDELIAYLCKNDSMDLLVAYIENVRKLFVPNDRKRGGIFMAKFHDMIVAQGIKSAIVYSALKI